MADALPISTAIAQLRNEIIASMRQAASAEIQFKLESIEMTLQLVATTNKNISAGVGLWQIATIDGALDRTIERTHQITLVLKPTATKGAAKSDVLVGDSDDWQPRPPTDSGHDAGSVTEMTTDEK